ncbi:MAG: hypothetical protein ABWY06_08915 [Pseudomonas sp.]|uniref:hypothetical protein n=1 Tax=Pseudomonas sp. TaxID=306 RepID=UPI0033938230
MRTVYDPTLKATLTLDDAGDIRAINHLDLYPEMENRRGREAASAYVREYADAFKIAPAALRALEQPVSYLYPQQQGVEYHYGEEKPAFDAATYAYWQTYLNTPVWAAGLTVTLKQAPARAVASTNTSEQGVDAQLPTQETLERYRRLFATAEKPSSGPVRRKAASDPLEARDDSDLLGEVLGQALEEGAELQEPSPPQLIRGRFFVYRYDADQRSGDSDHPVPGAHTHAHAGTPAQEEQGVCGTPPTLPLAPVPDALKDGRWYVVAELVFRLPLDGARLNWRALVEVESNTILYLRALASGVNGLVYTYDPITSTGTATNTPDQSNAVLNPHRDDVLLPNLNGPVAGTQALQGSRVSLMDIEPLSLAPPTRPSGSDFDYAVRTNEFAAVNAYFHNDRFFQLVENLGFPLASYFNGTAFPVEVDHRGKGTVANMGNTVNAHCVGDGDGIDHACYALADLGDTANPVGIAADWRVVLHELGGHGILYEHVGGPNFGFAHSAGDSFAMILNDFASEWHNGAALDRFFFLPFVPSIVRRSDRAVADGWGWGGANDVGSYSSEQILSTTLFRAYRSIGGDATSLTRREFAARFMSYLMLRAVGTLTPMSNPASPAQFLAALLAADALNWTSEGHFGGAYGKVLTWAFEEQNLNNGAAPSVDVYIDDGRAGEYPYLAVHWATTTIWNRREPDGLPGHQEPALEETNYAYVRIKNRGTSVANNVQVKGFHCKPSAGVLWPSDLQAMTTAQLAAGSLQPNNAEEKIVGPFEWTPVVNTWGHDCMLMIVSATGDPSNVDNFTLGEVVADWRLVPNDNNIGQRNVTLVPGGGGVGGLMAGLHGKGFWVGNPDRVRALVKVTVALPPLLASRGWKITLVDFPEAGVWLKPHEQRLVRFEVHPGQAFTREQVEATTERDILVTATANGAIIGGMVYRLDPALKCPYNDRPKGDRGRRCRDKAKDLLECLDLPDGKIKCVRVRKVSIDVEMDDSCDCD